MKICPKCKIEKAKTEFHKNSSTSDGMHCYCKKCRRVFYDANRRRILDYNIDWNNKNRDVIKKHNQKRVQTVKGRALQLWNAARLRAIDGGLEFGICTARIEFALLMGKCEKTGIPFDLTPHEKYKTNPFSPSIDKINSFGGYTYENIQVVCTIYNFAKGQMTDAEFLDFCKRFIAFNK